jgi:hypothetical protein
MIERLRTILLRRWMLLMLPPVLLGLALEGLNNAGLLSLPRVSDGSVLPTVLLLVSVTFGVALPLLYRAVFAHAHKQQSQVPVDALYRFENNCLIIVMSAPWTLLLAVAFTIPMYHLLGVALAALYGMYTQFPSHVRLSTDARIFRVPL